MIHFIISYSQLHMKVHCKYGPYNIVKILDIDVPHVTDWSHNELELFMYQKSE